MTVCYIYATSYNLVRVECSLTFHVDIDERRIEARLLPSHKHLCLVRQYYRDVFGFFFSSAIFTFQTTNVIRQ